jgi:hypothetical protein
VRLCLCRRALHGIGGLQQGTGEFTGVLRGHSGLERLPAQSQFFPGICDLQLKGKQYVRGYRE